MKPSIFGRIEAVNKELWVVLSLFLIALLLNHVVAYKYIINYDQILNFCKDRLRVKREKEEKRSWFGVF